MDLVSLVLVEERHALPSGMKIKQRVIPAIKSTLPVLDLWFTQLTFVFCRDCLQSLPIMVSSHECNTHSRPLVPGWCENKKNPSLHLT